jgi:hypothetical protein
MGEICESDWVKERASEEDEGVMGEGETEGEQGREWVGVSNISDGGCERRKGKSSLEVESVLLLFSIR